MKKTKRVFYLILMLLLTFSIFACKKNEDIDSNSEVKKQIQEQENEKLDKINDRIIEIIGKDADQKDKISHILQPFTNVLILTNKKAKPYIKKDTLQKYKKYVSTANEDKNDSYITYIDLVNNNLGLITDKFDHTQNGTGKFNKLDQKIKDEYVESYNKAKEAVKILIPFFKEIKKINDTYKIENIFGIISFIEYYEKVSSIEDNASVLKEQAKTLSEEIQNILDSKKLEEAKNEIKKRQDVIEKLNKDFNKEVKGLKTLLNAKESKLDSDLENIKTSLIILEKVKELLFAKQENTNILMWEVYSESLTNFVPNLINLFKLQFQYEIVNLEGIFDKAISEIFNYDYHKKNGITLSNNKIKNPNERQIEEYVYQTVKDAIEKYNNNYFKKIKDNASLIESGIDGLLKKENSEYEFVKIAKTFIEKLQKLSKSL